MSVCVYVCACEPVCVRHVCVRVRVSRKAKPCPESSHPCAPTLQAAGGCRQQHAPRGLWADAIPHRRLALDVLKRFPCCWHQQRAPSTTTAAAGWVEHGVAALLQPGLPGVAEHIQLLQAGERGCTRSHTHPPAAGPVPLGWSRGCKHWACPAASSC